MSLQSYASGNLVFRRASKSLVLLAEHGFTKNRSEELGAFFSVVDRIAIFVYEARIDIFPLIISNLGIESYSKEVKFFFTFGSTIFPFLITAFLYWAK